MSYSYHRVFVTPTKGTASGGVILARFQHLLRGVNGNIHTFSYASSTLYFYCMFGDICHLVVHCQRVLHSTSVLWVNILQTCSQVVGPYKGTMGQNGLTVLILTRVEFRSIRGTRYTHYRYNDNFTNIRSPTYHLTAHRFGLLVICRVVGRARNV